MSSLTPPLKTSSKEAPTARSTALLSGLSDPSLPLLPLSNSQEPVSAPASVATAPTPVRLGFLRRVYAILALQLLLTAAICAVFVLIPPIHRAVRSLSPALYVASIVGSVVALFALVGSSSHYPRNALLLASFTTCEAVLVGTVCAVYAGTGLGHLVLEALFVNLTVFFGITLYGFVSKRDFSFLGGALYAALVAVVVGYFVNWVLDIAGHKSRFVSFVLACGGSVLFSLFILYDTSLIMQSFGPDDALSAAIILYTDLPNVFLQFLVLLTSQQDR